MILRRKVARATDRMAALLEAGKAISTSLSLQSTLEVVVAQAARLASARACLLFLHDAASDEYAAEAALGVPEESLKLLRFQMGIGYHGQVVQSAQPALVENLGEAVGTEEMLASLKPTGALIVPLQGNESVIGTITCLDHDGGAFSTDDQDVLKMLASQATIAITNAILFERTKELDRLKSEFVAVVSHEVRTPLTSIKGSLELLGDDRFHKLPPPQKELLSICQANTERLINLINDILDFSKLESSKLSLNIEAIDAGAVLIEAVENIRNLAAQKEVGIDLKVDPSTGNDRGRPDAHRPGRHQPPRERDQVLARAEPHRDLRLRRRGPDHDLGERLRPGHFAARLEPPLPALRPARFLHHPEGRRNGAGPGHLQGDRRAARRQDLGRVGRRRGLHVLLLAPPAAGGSGRVAAPLSKTTSRLGAGPGAASIHPREPTRSSS